MYKVKIIPSSLRIRAQANTESAVLGSLPRGTIVNCSALTAGWYKLADSEGYISAQYVEVIEQADKQTEPDAPSTPDPTDSDIEKRLTAIEDALADIVIRLSALEG